MACGEGTAVIGCSPQQVLELVLDVERYRLADRKIGRVHWVRRDGNHGQVKHNGRLLGVATPRSCWPSRSRPGPAWTLRSSWPPGRCVASGACSRPA
jgi:hypothetical protein